MKELVLCDDGKPELVLPLCEKYGCGIEIQGFYKPDSDEIKEEIFERYNNILTKDIRKYFHAPFADLCLGSSNKRIVDVTRYYFDYAYEMASRLGAKRITVHHGYVPKTSFIPNWIKRAVSFWNNYLTDKSLAFDMENVVEYDWTIQKEIVEKVSDTKLGINLDIGHAYCNSKESVENWIKGYGDKITYVHIHNNYKENDDHNGLRNGTMDIVNVLSLLNKYAPNAIWAIESNLNEMEDSLKFLKENKFI
ncbi:MAG: sugar phosphate isomerase/epimerase [Clostridia bacterium]|nr:sugar phosphate isomerase/epimerase [Clostridia bacterium]